MTLPWGEFLTVWAFLAVNIASPGPNVLNTIACAMGTGRAAGLGSAAGVALGIGGWCLGMSLGLAGLRRGAAAPRGATGLDARAAFVRSLAVNATNAKALTSWIAILSLFPVARAAPGDIALPCAGARALSGGIHTLYALAFSTPPAARTYARWGWAVQAVAGLFFAGVAVKLALGLSSGS
ncbi:MAG: hypothetical protein IE927_07450 [Rhodobacterales bacterium]|nr:hypothetical protein [Rhodobacterales bacterium]